MNELSGVLDEIVADVNAVFLFSPGGSLYERFEDADDVTVVVVGAENAVDADDFVELPLDFRDFAGRVRFGMEGAMERDLVEDGDDVACVADVFDDEIDTISRVKTGEFSPSGVYDLFTNSRADPSVMRDVLEVSVELGKKGQKGKPVGALFVVGDAGR